VTGSPEVRTQELGLQYRHQATSQFDLRAWHRESAIGVYKFETVMEESLELISDSIQDRRINLLAFLALQRRTKLGEPALKM
jgi:hypothetical protein